MSKIKFTYSGPAHAAELITPGAKDGDGKDVERQTLHSGWLSPGQTIEIEEAQETHPTVAVWIARGWLTKVDPSTPAPAAPPALPPAKPIQPPAPAPTPSTPAA